MYFKSEKNKIGFKDYIILALLLVVYLFAGGYGFKLFPNEASLLFVGIGILITTVFLIYFLKKNAD